ncbi:hypothetical protein HZC34_03445 [Candidatus Saganbacteria bacterium]|nr:hypothetical protein [Candidatus Saganbacteria bacterium]
MGNKFSNIRILWLVLAICFGFGILIFGFMNIGCSSIQSFLNQANTDMKSSTFSALAALGLKTTGIVTVGGASYWGVTPSKITGKVATVFFPINNTEDEGVVVFGFYRPDLATSLTELKDFDLSQTTRLKGIMSKKPGYIGGPASMILMMYGYFNVYFNQGSPEAERVLRYAYATTGDYTKGDILLKNSTTGNFEWLNSSTGSLDSTRPSSPVANSTIKNWTDSTHPTMVFFPLLAKVTPEAATFTAALIDNNNLTITLDFNYANSLLFDGVTTEAQFNSLAPRDLIGKSSSSTWTDRCFMRQMRTAWNGPSTTDPGVYVTVSVEATPR